MPGDFEKYKSENIAETIKSLKDNTDTDNNSIDDDLEKFTGDLKRLKLDFSKEYIKKNIIA
jgi:hypothetical protein